MKRCFEYTSEGKASMCGRDSFCQEECDSIKVLMAIEFYKSLKPGDKLRAYFPGALITEGPHTLISLDGDVSKWPTARIPGYDEGRSTSIRPCAFRLWKENADEKVL